MPVRRVPEVELPTRLMEVSPVNTLHDAGRTPVSALFEASIDTSAVSVDHAAGRVPV